MTDSTSEDFSGIFTPTSNFVSLNASANSITTNNAAASLNGGVSSSTITTGTIYNFCTACGCNPCICQTGAYVQPTNPNWYTNIYPNQWSTSSTISWPIEEPAVKLFEMLLQGKDLITHKDKYLELIGKLSWVNGDNLQTVAVYERLRRLAKLLGIAPRKEKQDERKDV